MLCRQAEVVQQDSSQLAREFLKGLMLRRCFKNSLGPQQASNGCDGVGERRFAFGVPCRASWTNRMVANMLGEDQADHAEQAQQARTRTQDRFGYVLSGCLEPQVRPHLLEGRLDGPAGREPTDDLGRGQIRICRIEVIVPMSALDVMGEHPADRHQSLAALVPLCGSADQFHSPMAAASRRG